MDRGAWWATVHGVAKAGHDLATERVFHASECQKSGICIFVQQWCEETAFSCILLGMQNGTISA